MNDENESSENLSNEASITRNWAYQWKIYFNPDRSNQAQEGIFLRKTSIQSYPALTFDSSPVMRTTHYKHLGLILDEKLNFKEHLKKQFKTYKSIAILKKLWNIIQEILH